MSWKGQGLISNRERGAARFAAGDRPQPVSLVRWSVPVEQARTLRVTLHPLRTPGNAAPNPPLAVYSSEPAGGYVSPPDFSVMNNGMPVDWPCYVLMRWGVGAYQTQVIADWPRLGGGFDVAANNLEIDGLNMYLDGGGPGVTFGAHVAPGERANPESTQLTFTQQVAVLNGASSMTSIPSYAQRLTMRLDKAGSVGCTWSSPDGTQVGAFLLTAAVPYQGIIPSQATTLSIGALIGGALASLVWSINP